MHKVRLTVAALAIAGCAISAVAQLPRVFLLNPTALQRARSEAKANPQTPALQALRKRADRLLGQPLVSVMDKSQSPPSGDRHDYMSLAPYWWPNPKTATGLPYIRRDGERNPEINGIADHRNFGSVCNSAEILAEAYYVFGDERYAEKAAQILRTWFLDFRTRMNPNMQYAQAVKGINQGRGIGLIETRGIVRVVDAVGLLASSKAWSSVDQRKMQDWCSQYLEWLRTSKNGKDESAARNNHGSFYDGQVVALALFTGNTDLARSVVENARTKRIQFQIERDGAQPLELARTKSISYSVFNLTALFDLARLGDNVGVDLWSYDSGGRSLRAALDYLLPYALGERKWTRKQIEPLDGRSLVPLLLQAANRYHDPAYRADAAKIDPNAEADARWQ
jgi:hypothetical protein